MIHTLESIVFERNLTEEESLNLLNLPDEEILSLAALAFRVQRKYSPEYHVCSITNAKSGQCKQNCSYCAQSAFHKTNISSYPLVSEENLLKQAEEVYRTGVRHFGIVTSGYGFLHPNEEFDTILHAIERLRERFPDMEICASLGVLSEETARMLVESGIREYNHNLQVHPQRYAELVATTHTIEDRLQTLSFLRKYPIRICSGCILGLGETMEDRIQLALLLRKMGVDIIPINVLIPIQGTRMEKRPVPSVREVLFTVSVYRLILRDKVIKLAAGRETLMKDFQGLLLLSGANGFLTGGYLTTRGRSREEDKRFLEELFSIAHPSQQ